jgi:hypothetical protein
MRSRQINFFLTAADQAALLKYLDTRVEFVVIESVAEGDRLQRLETAEVKIMGVDRLKVCLVRPNDIGAVQLTALKNQPYKPVDVLRSPVVEFVRCHHADNILRRGRLYFVTAYFDRRTLVRKDDAFLKWAGTLIAAARRKLMKDSASLFYFGEEALRLKETGTEMAQL